jgi:hypothetical protein
VVLRDKERDERPDESIYIKRGKEANQKRRREQQQQQQ